MRADQQLYRIIFIALTGFCSCAPVYIRDQQSNTDTVPSLESVEFSVEEAKEWTALFHRTSGWFGADGIFSIPMDGNNTVPAQEDSKTLFIFSDTMIGDIADSTLQPGATMVNNTVAYLKGGKPEKNNIDFEWAKDAEDKPRSLFIPATSSAQKGDYYWLGDGFVNSELDHTTYLFAYRMRNMDPNEDWSFKEMGNVIIALPHESRPPFEDQRQLETPFHFEDGGFGAGVFVNTEASGAPDPDGYIYIYGVRGQEKNLVVARVLPEAFEDFSSWRFWDGSKWNPDIKKVAHLTQEVSNELSVSPLPDGRYALVFQKNGMSSVVGLRLGHTPYGPFGPVIPLWDCAEPLQKNYFTYNAKAHPNLSRPSELLISYNVNAFDFFNEINKNPSLYRPRFIKVKFKTGD